jgi:hypothetical protein
MLNLRKSSWVGFTRFADSDDKIVQGARHAKQGNRGEMSHSNVGWFLANAATLVGLIDPSTTVARPAGTCGD